MSDSPGCAPECYVCHKKGRDPLLRVLHDGHGDTICLGCVSVMVAGYAPPTTAFDLSRGLNWRIEW